MRRCGTQAGFTLVELLVSLAIGAMLVLPVARTVQTGLAAQRVAADRNDIGVQARFAMRRMTAAIAKAAPGALGAKATESTSGDWLAPVAFCLNGAAQVIETTPADTACVGTRVLAERVSAFAVRSFDAGARAATVVEIRLALAGPTGAAIDLTARARLGGAP